MKFRHNHIVSVDQFSRDDIEQLFEVTSRVKGYAQQEHRPEVLRNYILLSLFFEPSTRTRLSFGSAFNMLGGHVRETTGTSSSSIVKGESLGDFARVVSCYGDIAVVRHPEIGSVAEYARNSGVPVINAGDGANEHPTQALLDIYTIQQELSKFSKSVDNIRIALVGDLKYGRTVHSLLKLLCLFEGVSVHLISPRQFELPDQISSQLKKQNHTVKSFEDLESGIEHVDVLYVTRMQEERVSASEKVVARDQNIRVNREVYERICDSETIILHPLPRDARPSAQELSTDLDNHPNLAIFRQAENGLFVRMALFALILDVVEQLPTLSN